MNIERGSYCGQIRYSFEGEPGTMIIAVGTRDVASFFRPGMAIFTRDAQSFHHIGDDIPSLEGLPG